MGPALKTHTPQPQLRLTGIDPQACQKGTGLFWRVLSGETQTGPRHLYGVAALFLGEGSID